MPITVEKLFKSIDLEAEGPVSWGEPVNFEKPGVYVVAISDNASKLVTIEDAPISIGLIEKWISNVPSIQLNNNDTTCIELKERLCKFWLPDETVLYIGKTSRSLAYRINQFYLHALGKKRPHRGGCWIKTLCIINDLNIYWAATEDFDIKEDELLDVFKNKISSSTKEILFDSENLMPFANLEYPRGTRKGHGISNATNDILKGKRFPLPNYWRDIHMLLSEAFVASKKDILHKLPEPLILGGWRTCESVKHERWIDTLEWADKYNFLNAIANELKRTEFCYSN